MAITIKTAFDIFSQRLNITDYQTDVVSATHEYLRQLIANEFEVRNHFLTGSYRRNTMIAPLSEADIDIFIVLADKYYDSTSVFAPANLLDQVKRVLKKRYPDAPAISRNGQAVTIKYDKFEVDIVPAFERLYGGFLIPNTYTNSWIKTDPKKHVEIWSKANAAHNNLMIPLIKMLKCWNRAHSKRLRSFHLETLTLQVFNNVSFTSYSSGARYFFDKARNWIGFPLSDPAGYDPVGGYLDTSDKKREVLDSLNTAYIKAADAEQLDNQGRIPEAIAKWQIVFGDYFPAYG